MLVTETTKLEISESLKKKIDIICKFANTKYQLLNGSVRNVKGTNIAYAEPHRLIIEDITYFLFDDCDEVYINNLYHSIKLQELEKQIKQRKN